MYIYAVTIIVAFSLGYISGYGIGTQYEKRRKKRSDRTSPPSNRRRSNDTIERAYLNELPRSTISSGVGGERGFYL